MVRSGLAITLSPLVWLAPFSLPDMLSMVTSARAALGLAPSSLDGKTSSCRWGGMKRGGVLRVVVVLLLDGEEGWLEGCSGEEEEGVEERAFAACSD